LRLIKEGLSPWLACRTAITQTLTDDQEIMNSVEDIIKMFYEPEGSGQDLSSNESSNVR
jgi:hypothetical protein